MRSINEVLLKISKRAESHEPEHLIGSFVNMGSIFTILKNQDSQIIFGRRGTGKTHLLSYLTTQILQDDRLAILIDMRTMGSTGGLYSDPTLSLPERGTRLLVDTLICIHEKILTMAVAQAEELNLGILGPLLDSFVDASLQVVIEGKVETNTSEANQETSSSSTTFSGSLKGVEPSLGIGTFAGNGIQRALEFKQKREGREILRINFGSVQREFQRLVSALPKSQLWIILDEWSEVPLDLQPYLADLIRRCILPARGVTVKIAAIEQRCRFRISDENVGHIGIEIGADAATALNLDEYLVFDNNKEKSKQFFSELLFRHSKSIASEIESKSIPDEISIFMSEVFTQAPVLDEFVKSCEGVPRDAINIIGLAAQNSPEEKISMLEIRRAARSWYTRAKANAISTKPEAQRLLNWIIDEVIKHRQARAFLLESETKDPLIEFLYDARVLHVIKQGVASNDSPGKRYTVYAIDYGCYVDLINTSRAPKGLFEIENENEISYEDVPQTDYRSIRRAILNLTEFYSDSQHA